METQRILPTDNLGSGRQIKEGKEGYLIPLGANGEAIAVGNVCVVGRDPGCQLSLPDPFASSRHARIELRNGIYSVRDLQSRNGTFLNGSRVSEASLSIGDKLQFGESSYLFSETPAERSEISSKNLEWTTQLKRLPAFAATEFPVLITGPSGSGKEILSRALHRYSPRKDGPFIGLNCSALSEHLIESELFGHIKGSFTGASHDRKGAFEAARGGTLFLDEIGDLPLSLQPKLLRALESKEIRPVGADRSVQTDVRVVAATHQNLALAIREGRFREDLYYRLNVCHVRPPALKDRIEDFEDLLYSFAKHYRVRFSHQAVLSLKTYRWPGNIRELKNVIARASAYYPGQHIQPEDLKAIMEPTPLPPEVHFVAEPSPTTPPSSIIKEIEKEMIIRRLRMNRGNQRRTAIDLGMPKSTLNDRIKHYAIDVKNIMGPETGFTA